MRNVDRIEILYLAILFTMRVKGRVVTTPTAVRPWGVAWLPGWI